jgi:hypothetical protein
LSAGLSIQNNVQQYLEFLEVHSWTQKEEEEVVHNLRRVQLLSETDSRSIAIHIQQEGENDGP